MVDPQCYRPFKIKALGNGAYEVINALEPYFNHWSGKRSSLKGIKGKFNDKTVVIIVIKEKKEDEDDEDVEIFLYINQDGSLECEEGKSVGRIFVSSNTHANEWTLRSLYGSPDMYTGVGSFLLECVTPWLSTKRLPVIVVSCNTSAPPFYEKMRFTCVKTSPMFWDGHRSIP